MRYHITLVRMAISRKSTDNECWRECGEKGNLLHCWWECKLVQLLWRTIWRVLKKLKTELPYDSAIPSLKENHNLKRYMSPSVHCRSIYNNQDMEATECPLTEKWIKKMWYVYTMGYYSAIKRKNKA